MAYPAASAPQFPVSGNLESALGASVAVEDGESKSGYFGSSSGATRGASIVSNKLHLYPGRYLVRTSTRANGNYHTVCPSVTTDYGIWACPGITGMTPVAGTFYPGGVHDERWAVDGVSSNGLYGRGGNVFINLTGSYASDTNTEHNVYIAGIRAYYDGSGFVTTVRDQHIVAVCRTNSPMGEVFNCLFSLPYRVTDAYGHLGEIILIAWTDLGSNHGSMSCRWTSWVEPGPEMNAGGTWKSTLTSTGGSCNIIGTEVMSPEDVDGPVFSQNATYDVIVSATTDLYMSHTNSWAGLTTYGGHNPPALYSRSFSSRVYCSRVGA